VTESNTRRLTAEEARNKSAECREMAKRVAKREYRIMLDHMAETWDRIALDLDGKSDQRGP
jgi:hypothetical protein